MLSTGNTPKAHRLYELRVRRVPRACEPPLEKTLSSPGDAARAFNVLADGEAREVFMVASLDARNRCIGIELAAIGDTTGVSVHPREVFRSAILSSAAAVIVAHNHPSGTLEPSAADDALTVRLRDAGELLGIPVLDHLIVEGEAKSARWYSFAERW